MARREGAWRRVGMRSERNGGPVAQGLVGWGPWREWHEPTPLWGSTGLLQGGSQASAWPRVAGSSLGTAWSWGLTHGPSTISHGKGSARLRRKH